MRSAQAPVELGAMRSTLGTAGAAYPMLSRGRMVGALVCGDKTEERAYDPDERTLLAHLAHETGTSLLFLRTDSMSSERPPRPNAMR
jgi:GAF domain-containing protein